MLRESNLPYWQRDAFGEALAFRLLVVVIKLGTNDSKSHWNAAAIHRALTGKDPAP